MNVESDRILECDFFLALLVSLDRNYIFKTVCTYFCNMFFPYNFANSLDMKHIFRKDLPDMVRLMLEEGANGWLSFVIQSDSEMRWCR